jgi:coenzyme F420-reducing hydrogenase delta subunit
LRQFSRAILALLSLTLPAAEPPSAITGAWEIVRVIPTTNTQTAPDAKATGKRFTYAADAADLAGVRIDEPEYELETLEAADFAVEYRATLTELGVESGHIRVVRVLRKGEQVTEMGATLFLAGRRRLVTVWDGVFYELRRAR